MDKLIESIDLVTNFYTYEGVVRALNQVSLTVRHGSTFGLVGESGCGKSVFVRSLMRIVQEPGRIEAGEVRMHLDPDVPDAYTDLLSLSEASMRSLRGDRISMIFQEPNAALNPTMSVGWQVMESYLFHQSADMSARVAENLRAEPPSLRRGLLLPLYELSARDPDAMRLRLLSRIPVLKWWRKPLLAEARRRAVEIIGLLGIPNPERVAGLYPHNLSGGMKQRIVIAIALACRPMLLIADEATSNLDVTIQAQIIDLLKRLKEEVISSILLITHDLGVVAETCDQVGVMYAGNLVEVAEVRELFRSPLHPYTRALLDSVPKMSTSGPLRSIEGNVPNLVEPPSGCRFHPRCPHVMDVCRVQRPELAVIRDNHQAACHLLNASMEETA